MKVVLDTDIGNGICGANTDDGLALALLLASKDIELLGISTLSGNVLNTDAYKVSKALLNELDLDIPVYLGAARALLEPSKPWRDRLDNTVYRHKLEYLWQEKANFDDINIPKIIDAPSKLCELARTYKNELIICAIGPLTNIAIACTLDSDFASNLKELVIMGGVFDMPRYPKDTNFGFDPEAAKIVLRSGAKITLAPYNITMQTSLKHEDLDNLKAINNKLCDWLYKSIKPWISFAELTRKSDGTWIHDALTVAYLLDSSICKSDEYYLDVVSDTQNRGATLRYSEDLAMNIGINLSDLQKIKVLRDIDNAKLLKLIEKTLKESKC